MFLGHRKFHNQMQNKQSGMSIIEIVIVIALIGTIMAIILQNFTGKQREAMIDATKISMKTLEQNLQLYRVHNYMYPTTEQGLKALLTAPSDAKKWRGPYVDSEDKLRDPFDSPFEYESDGRNFKVISAGPDKQIGSEDDITYPEPAAEPGSNKEG